VAGAKPVLDLLQLLPGVLVCYKLLGLCDVRRVSLGDCNPPRRTPPLYSGVHNHVLLRFGARCDLLGKKHPRGARNPSRGMVWSVKSTFFFAPLPWAGKTHFIPKRRAALGTLTDVRSLLGGGKGLTRPSDVATACGGKAAFEQT